MSTAIANVPAPIDASILERVLAMGDLSKLSSTERLSYMNAVCQSVGLNPLTRPFEFITLNNKLTMYARKDATDQLRNLRTISIQIVEKSRIDDLYVVVARAHTPDGRQDEEIGAVNVLDKKGDDLANAMMKALTKAKRRVTLSICGLGCLDETELETIPNARPVATPQFRQPAHQAAADLQEPVVHQAEPVVNTDDLPIDNSVFVDGEDCQPGQIKALWAIAYKLWTKEEASSELHKLLKEVAQIDSLKQLSRNGAGLFITHLESKMAR